MRILLKEANKYPVKTSDKQTTTKTQKTDNAYTRMINKTTMSTQNAQ